MASFVGTSTFEVAVQTTEASTSSVRETTTQFTTTEPMINEPSTTGEDYVEMTTIKGNKSSSPLAVCCDGIAVQVFVITEATRGACCVAVIN